MRVSFGGRFNRAFQSPPSAAAALGAACAMATSKRTARAKQVEGGGLCADQSAQKQRLKEK
jgi:hypothetical protein